MKVLHIITGLGNGGAEGVLYRLCLNDKEYKHIIISLTDLGFYGQLLINKGVVVHQINLSLRNLIPKSFHLFRKLKDIKPDVIQTWMYHADLFGGLIARLGGYKNIFWNIRHTNLSIGESKTSTILIFKISSLLSFIIPKQIICCADESLKVHHKNGYNFSKMIVIPNGYDTSVYFPDKVLRIQTKSDLDLSEKFVVLGMIGRFHPQKNHLGLIKALSIVKNSFHEFKFILVGRDLNSSNLKLNNEIKKYNLESNILMLDQRSDIPAIMNALDINVLSSSSGEGFPNVLPEAMSCSVPCVTTDVGDAVKIVGSSGWIAPPNDSDAMAKAILGAINEFKNDTESWGLRKKSCRERIIDNYSLDKMIKNYHEVWNT